MPATIKPLLDKMSECRNLPTNQLVNGRRLPTRAIVNLDNSGGGIMWLAFAFESVSVKDTNNEYIMVVNFWNCFILKRMYCNTGNRITVHTTHTN